MPSRRGRSPGAVRSDRLPGQTSMRVIPRAMARARAEQAEERDVRPCRGEGMRGPWFERALSGPGCAAHRAGLPTAAAAPRSPASGNPASHRLTRPQAGTVALAHAWRHSATPPGPRARLPRHAAHAASAAPASSASEQADLSRRPAATSPPRPTEPAPASASRSRSAAARRLAASIAAEQAARPTPPAEGSAQSRGEASSSAPASSEATPKQYSTPGEASSPAPAVVPPNPTAAAMSVARSARRAASLRRCLALDTAPLYRRPAPPPIARFPARGHVAVLPASAGSSGRSRGRRSLAEPVCRGARRGPARASRAVAAARTLSIWSAIAPGAGGGGGGRRAVRRPARRLRGGRSRARAGRVRLRAVTTAQERRTP